jgi:hypothetical protein
MQESEFNLQCLVVIPEKADIDDSMSAFLVFGSQIGLAG